MSPFIPPRSPWLSQYIPFYEVRRNIKRGKCQIQKLCKYRLSLPNDVFLPLHRCFSCLAVIVVIFVDVVFVVVVVVVVFVVVIVVMVV